MFEELVEEVAELPKRERPGSDWIRPGTWALVDERASKRKQGALTQAEGRRLTRAIHKAFAEDRKLRAARAGHEIIAYLEAQEYRKAWGTLRAWHKEVDPAASKPCYDTLEEQAVGRENLYRARAPPGDRIPSNTERPPLPDGPPTDEELRQATKTSSNGRTGGATKMRAEDLKEWLRGMESEERAQSKGEAGLEGAGDCWRLLVRLCQHIWRTGEIPQRMLLAIVVLIPKGSSGDFKGIGLLEVVWKLLERVLNLGGREDQMASNPIFLILF